MQQYTGLMFTNENDQNHSVTLQNFSGWVAIIVKTLDYRGVRGYGEKAVEWGWRKR